MRRKKVKLPNVDAALAAVYAKDLRPYPVQSLWASKIGHPCRRFLVYEQTHWNTKPEITPALKMRFSLGDLHGRQIVRDLQDAFARHSTIEIGQQEVPIPPNDFGISGRIDAVMTIRGRGRDRTYVPIEIKTMAETVFRKVKTLRDMMEGSSLYLRLYPGQLMTYLHFAECPVGIFVLRDKSSGAYRTIEVPYDAAYMARLLETAKIVTKSVACYRAATPSQREKVLPPRVPWERDVCGRCDHLATCLPDMYATPGIEDRLGDQELATMLDVRDRTAESFAAYKKADDALSKHIAAICNGIEPGECRTIIAPKHTITVKASKRKSYDIPADVKAKYETDSTTIRKTIEPIEGGDDGKQGSSMV